MKIVEKVTSHTIFKDENGKIALQKVVQNQGSPEP